MRTIIGRGGKGLGLYVGLVGDDTEEAGCFRIVDVPRDASLVDQRSMVNRLKQEFLYEVGTANKSSLSPSSFTAARCLFC